MREQWIEAPRMEGNKSLAGKFGISPLTVRLIRNRAGESEEAVRTYLWGDLDSLGDAGQMKGMKEAAALLGEKAAWPCGSSGIMILTGSMPPIFFSRL